MSYSTLHSGGLDQLLRSQRLDGVPASQEQSDRGHADTLQTSGQTGTHRGSAGKRACRVLAQNSLLRCPTVMESGTCLAGWLAGQRHRAAAPATPSCTLAGAAILCTGCGSARHLHNNKSKHAPPPSCRLAPLTCRSH